MSEFTTLEEIGPVQAELSRYEADGIEDNSKSKATCNAEPLAFDCVDEPAPFPVDVLPPELADFCREVAESTVTPPDIAGCAMLVTGGAAIGNSRALCVKESWMEVPCHYLVNAAETSTGKTPAMQAVARRYEAMQDRLLAKYKADLARFQQDKAQHDEDLARCRRARRSMPMPPVEPRRPERFVAMDATVESLAPLLEANPRGLHMSLDEATAWVRGMNQYKGGRGNDRQFWLSVWSAKSHTVDRKNLNGIPISIPHPFINVICGMPPDMLGELTDPQNRNDGFLHRILFSFPKTDAGTKWTDVSVSNEACDRWTATLTRLRSLAMARNEDGIDSYRQDRFSPQAKERWVDWWDSHAKDMRNPDLAKMLGPWGKLKTYAARLTLLLHYLWWAQGNEPEGDVQPASVDRASRLVDYFKSHLRLVYSRLGQSHEDKLVADLLCWIRERGGECTARDVVRAKKVTPTPRAKQILDELVERGYGHFQAQKAPNNKDVVRFVLDLA